MAMDLDEHDLYPPDHEDLTPEARQHRNRVAIGTALVVWGTSLLVQRALRVDLDTFFLGLGLAAAAGWTQHRRYPWFVAGAIGIGLGIGDLARIPFDGTFGTSISMLALAAGFAAIYVRYPRRSSWTLPVAAFFALIGVGSFGVGLIGLVPAVLGRFLLPLLLIGGGVLLLLRNSLPPKAVKTGLAALALSFVLVGATSVPEMDERVSVEAAIPQPPGQELPPLQGRTLVISGGSGDVELRTSDDGTARIEVTEADGFGPRHGPGPRGTAGFSVAEDGDRVVIDGGGRHGPFGGESSASYVLTLPDGVKLDIERDAGDITGDVAGAAGRLRTGRGDIDLTLRDGGAEGSEGDGPYDVETADGDVTIDSRVRVVLDVEADDGVITIDGRRIDDDEYESEDDETGAELDVDNDEGDVTITRPDAATSPSPTTTAAATGADPEETPAAPSTPAVPGD